MTDENFKAYTTYRPDLLKENFNLSDPLDVLIHKILTPNPNQRIQVSQLKSEFKAIKTLRQTIPAVGICKDADHGTIADRQIFVSMCATTEHSTLVNCSEQNRACLIPNNPSNYAFNTLPEIS
jgi:hypothetical protein